ncbi:MAG: cupin domain-containing protein [Saprospiraceae bacterium]|nr:cupin domain-containing protein [Saprospiraceae bacterium]HMW38921.1 cupin domain-containing protein [Saprospiraceae bacterium]HMX88101.1 cupin domain-containing protein [Saprospiraceae bacterium]HMZ38932.1 cupin domain-containing protein [Saprospiraceae bacterium]HNA65385.1 cupin domain-containing protein [Saprospiraceae bacterium]
MKKINKIILSEKFSQFSEHWSPKIIGELNGQQVRIAKLQGEFIWHSHALEDELFLVINGELTIELKEQDNIVLREGEMVIIPKGIEHRPVAAAEVWLMLFEPASTINTGEINSERTISKPDYLF